MLRFHFSERGWPSVWRLPEGSEQLINGVLFRATEDRRPISGAPEMLSMSEVGDVTPAARLIVAWWIQGRMIRLDAP